MVLQVEAYAGQGDSRRDPVFGQVRRIADAGQHQQLRRPEHAAAQDQLAVRMDHPSRRGADTPAPSPGRPAAGPSMRPPRPARSGSGDAGPAADRRRTRCTGGHCGSSSAGGRSLPTRRCCSRRSIHDRWRARRPRRHPSANRRNDRTGRPSGPLPPRAASSPPSHRSSRRKIGQHVLERPIRQARCRPAVVVARVAADIRHRVGGRRTADHLAARALHRTACDGRAGARRNTSSRAGAFAGSGPQASGMLNQGSRSQPPASSSRTVAPPALRRLASTQPAEPARR